MKDETSLYQISCTKQILNFENENEN